MNCRECGEEFKHIGNHWRYNESHRPTLSKEEIEILTGVLMGDGSLYRGSKNVSFRVGNTNIEYLNWLDNRFSHISRGVSLSQTAESLSSHDLGSDNPENFKDLYLWRTTAHPQLNRFRDWYTKNGKTWPENIEMSPNVLKHWYCCDGSTNNNGWIKITLCNEFENKNKVEEYFNKSGLPKPSRWSEGKDICWTLHDSRELLSYMGKPLPGFEYKWSEDLSNSSIN
jgi:hypothetical protein